MVICFVLAAADALFCELMGFFLLIIMSHLLKF